MDDETDEGDEPGAGPLSNAGLAVEEADLAELERSPDAEALLAPDDERATVVGADLSRLADDRFRDLFGDALARLRAAAARLPDENRVYVVGLRTDRGMERGGVDLRGERAPGFVVGADLVAAYAARPGGDGATFAHLARSLLESDYLLPAVPEAGRLDGPATTMDGLRRELVARHARRLTLLGDGDGDGAGSDGAYHREFRAVLAVPVDAAAWLRGRDERSG